MIIESSESFGLSQLHQLRGRVGRGAEQSYCILMTSYKLSAEGKLRMETMCATNDGFEIADVDLKLRGPGDMAGTIQSGVLDLNIADLAKEAVPDYVNLAYGSKNLSFGSDYIIPKPIDNRLISTVSPAVAKAAMESGIAQLKITDWEAYRTELDNRLGKDNRLMRSLVNKAKTNPKRVVFGEANTYKILKAAQMVRDEGIAKPILLGNKEKINKLIAEHHLDLHEIPIIDPFDNENEAMRNDYAEILWKKRQRKGLTQYDCRRKMTERNYFGAMMVETGAADAMISGLTRKYSAPVVPAIQCIGTAEGHSRLAGLYMIITKRGPFFFADCTMNVDPTAEELVEITTLTAKTVKQFNVTPRIAMLSYTNFGSSAGDIPNKVQKAVKILHKDFPGLIVDGDLQANFALNNTLLEEEFSFSTLADKDVNTLIFPNLSSANIAYKMMQELGGAEAIGPILMGLKKPVHVLQLGSSVREIVNMVTIAVVEAQN